MAGSRKRTNGTGAVYQDKTTGQWVGEAFVDGKRRRVKARTKVDASKRIVDLLRDADQGVAAVDGNATVSTLLDLWRERVLPNRDLSPSSLDNYDRALRMLGHEFGRVRLRSLDVDRIEHGLDRLATGTVGPSRGKPLSRRSLKLFRSTFAQVLDFGVRRKLIPGNPARTAELTPTAAKGKPRRSLTADEAETLWAALEGERLGNLFRLMLVTGLRPGEALGLAWDAVDLDAGLLHVRRAVRREHGRAVLVDEVKTSGSWRTIGLPEPAVEVLRAQRRAVAELKLAARVWAMVDAELVFPTSQGTPWDLANARDELTRICADAGIGRITPHELRHSCASILNDRGVPLELIADLLGHVDTTMLARTYRHRLRPSADAAVEVMGDMFGSRSS
jgi:integrase